MKTASFSRRQALGVLLSVPLMMMAVASHAATDGAQQQLQALESAAGGRLGVYAIDTASGKTVAWRADERFPFCSTFKTIAASALLKRSESAPDFLNQRIHYSHSDIVNWSPVTEKHLSEGMTLAELSAAALQYSDNTAVNLMVDALGGIDKVNEFARSIGDNTFRLDRRETELNSAIPGDERDTTTPAAMSHSLQKLALGNALGETQRSQLVTWMKGNTTGARRIQAGVPSTWTVADKTGAGDYGTTNDIAVIWPEQGGPLVVSIYYTREQQNSPINNDIIAAATRIAVAELQKK
ncbi:class A beta-lactamase [Entomohabitans teleogrylli]|uniref:class A beta-lactamase n=1 Tax=Entomohabitans teleogrylli TaxID=1384589 RepID=UPI00073D4546|nr:class A beta-lactamase [Entomohabitans teleogrylli]